MTSLITRQFGRPRGWLGALAGWIMATRPSNRQRNAWAIGLLEIASEDCVLEIGYGPGLALAAAANLARRGLIVGLDHSRVMHAQALARNRRPVEGGLMMLRAADLEDLSRMPISFDKALAVNVAQFWPQPRAALRTIHGRMRAGGSLALAYQPRMKGATAAHAAQFAARFSEHLEDAGFSGSRLERLELKPVPAVCLVATA